MSTIVELLKEAGIIPEGAQREHQRWSFTPEPEDQDPDILPRMPEQLPSAIAEVLAESEYTFSRQTDLDSLKDFAAHQRDGVLILRTDSGKKLQAQTHFYITRAGNYRFPYESSDMIDFMTDGRNFLQYEEANGELTQVWFSSGAYLHYGEQQTFCELAPSTKRTVQKKETTREQGE